MKRSVIVIALLLVFSFTAFADQHIVRFTNGIPSDFNKTVTAMGGTVVSSHPVMAVVSGLTPAAAITLGASKGVAEVVSDETVVLDDTTGSAAAVNSAAVDPTQAYLYAAQWNMMAIGADKAWAAGKLGDAGVTVAVIDSGVDYKLYDLRGHVDLSRSATFQPDENVIIDALFPSWNHVTDLLFHGTHVANTIVSNGVLSAGVTAKTTLIAVKVLKTNPATGSASGSLGAILSGVLWAADHGADIANMSLGGGFTKAGNGRTIGAINSTFNYAHRKGMLIVVAAGNSAIDLDHDGNLYVNYCDTPNVLCVAATGPTAEASPFGPWTNIDAPATYSNYGRSSIDVAAPGGNHDSFIYQGCSETSLIFPDCQDTRFLWYVSAQGTSMATPHVSGLAALLVAQMGHGNPAQIKARILQGADDLGQPGTDPFYGKGFINVPKTLGIK
jgi:subtilisin family serine protease